MTDIISMLEIPLIQNMFLATALACVLCGVIGTYVVVNRMVAVTGGIAHTTFGGVGFAYFAMSVLAVSWMTPMAGALLFGIAAAVIMAVCRRNGELREDTVIGALWAAGMAAGVVFMCYTDRSVIVPSSYESILFGNMLLIDSGKLAAMAVITAAVLAVTAFFFRDLRIMTFDANFARISGINVTVLDLILHILIAVTCVMVANVVGIVMIMALMTIPAAMGNMFSHGMKGTMALGTVYALFLSVAGLFLSLYMDTPPGATVVLVIAAAFIVAVLAKRLASRAVKNGD
ncbi:MAG: metal ABC transporter permease [Candidatus Methanomethylophilaceae archaeon]|nr:metal ABC transporter permease [Candidatus Methanomethylophilaceae archaeon]